jgi:cytochrome c5
MSDEHPESFIKTPTQLIVVVVLAFVVPIAIIYMIIQMVMSGTKSDHPAMSDKAVAERIQPAGSSKIGNEPSPLLTVPAPAAAPATPAAPGAQATAANDSNKGKAVYDASCVACHGAGVAGAPKSGDAAAWAPRIKAGADALYANALKGKNAMPPKGGNLALADADVKAAVDYMVSQSK